VRNTDADAMTLKHFHVTKVQRKVTEKNITLHPPRYRSDSIKKMNIGTRSSRRTAYHPVASHGIVKISVMIDVILYNFSNVVLSSIASFHSRSNHRDTVTIMKNKHSWMVMDKIRTIR